MSDINSGAPIRSQLPSQVNYDDIIVKLGDATNPATQQASVDTHGSVQSRIADAAGNVITSTNQTTARALDVNIWFGNALIDPRAIRALTATDVVTANQGTAAATHASPWWIRLTDGTNDSAILATGELKVAVTQLLSEDHNYGTVGAATLRVASQLGNATGSANYNYGTVGAQTLRTASQIGNATGAADFGYGAVSVQTLRAASQLGNATGAADFANGVTGAQTLRVAANLAVAGADVSSTNPVPVTITASSPGTPVDAYNTASAVAAGATSNHQYTVTAGKTLQLEQIEASASGKMKIEVQIETGVATGVFVTRFVQFNSTNTPNCSIHITPVIPVAAGVRVQIIRTNKDLLAQDLYSTIGGQEV